jgi:hypothetical protein
VSEDKLADLERRFTESGDATDDWIRALQARIENLEAALKVAGHLVVQLVQLAENHPMRPNPQFMFSDKMDLEGKLREL